jgi:GNAT superfamily N-acetyltransferase
MKYTYVTNYKNNDELRHSFNKLVEKSFYFNFDEWFNNGFWGEKYIPCSLINGKKVIANVSVNLMDFNMDGVEKHYIQIGTVMTDEEYQGQGLSRYLMEKVIEEYRYKSDGIYLFASDSVIDFYPRFGFTKSIEYQYSKSINTANNEMKIEQVNISNMIDRQRFLTAVKNSVNNERLSMDNYGLITFWTTGPMKDLIYYFDDEDAYIIADIEDDNLWIYQIISTRKVNLEKVISAFGSSIKNVTLGFTPYDTEGYDVKEYHKEDCTLFYFGKDLENIEKKKLIFPTLSHA